MRTHTIAALGVLCAVAGAARADVRVPGLFSDHMVIQRDVPAAIWGWADPDDAVTVTCGEFSVTQEDHGGFWRVTLPEHPAGPVPDIVIAGKNTIRIRDVLAGEVWLCSGQSNMQWALRSSAGGAEAIASANFPAIRLLTVPNIPAKAPRRELEWRWNVCSPATVPTFSAVGFYFGRALHQQLDPSVPIGLINSSWGGTSIQAWTPRAAIEAEPQLARDAQLLVSLDDRYRQAVEAFADATRRWLAAFEQARERNQDLPDPPRSPVHPLDGGPQHASSLYNGMIHPLMPYAIRGAIWYQGESNRGDGSFYFTRLKTMIEAWRNAWGIGDFPVGVVQLAPYSYSNPNDLLPRLWEAQARAAAEVPNVGLAVIHDTVEKLNDIHPPRKQEVGERLALWALAKVYGRSDLVYAGPTAVSHQVEGNAIRVRFEHVGSGLVSRDGKPLNWFTVAGEDRKFVDAVATIDGDSVVVSAESVPNPVAVRFGWDQLAQPNLMNQEGRPAAPFRTDDW